MADISKINVNNTEYNIKDATARSQNIIEGQASGSIATFNNGGNGIPMKSCEVAIVAQQASGTPSPSNPLSITGFSSIALSVSDGVTPITTNVSLGQTIYGGTAELVGGNGIKTHGYVDLSTLSWTSTSQNRWVATLSGVKEVTTGLSPIIAEKYETFSNNDLYYNNKTGIATYNNQVIVRNNPTTDTPTGLAVFELQTPTTFTFTGASIPTLSGVNNVYADSGDVDLEYFNENADEIAELVRLYQHKYSTEEHIVGTWIDGKPLYEKTVSCGAIPNAESTGGAWVIGISETAHNISNLDKIVYINGIGVGNGNYYPLPCTSNAYDNVDVYVESGYILIVTDGLSWRGKTTNSYVTLRYTKS